MHFSDDQSPDDELKNHGPSAAKHDDADDEAEDDDEDEKAPSKSADDDEDEEEEEEKPHPKTTKAEPDEDEDEEEDDTPPPAPAKKKASADDDDDDWGSDDEAPQKTSSGGIWDAFMLDPGVIKSREEFENVSQESWEDDDGSWDVLNYDKAAQEFFGDHEHFGETAYDLYQEEGYEEHVDNQALLAEAARLPGVSTKTFDFFERDGTVAARGVQNAQGLASLKEHWPDFDFSLVHVTVPAQQQESYRATRLPDPFKKVALADTVDLRHYCPPVVSQGQTSRCSAFAWSHALEIGGNIVKRPLPPLSANFTMMKFLRFAGQCKDYANTYSGGGGSPRSPELGTRLLEEGTCREELWSNDSKQPRASDEAMINDARRHRLENASVQVVALDDLKHALSGGSPVHLIMNTGPEFAKTGRDGLIKAAEKPEGRHGCHAMVIVGYFGNHFIVKNSWGQDWGDKGYCYIPKAVLAKANIVLTALVLQH